MSANHPEIQNTSTTCCLIFIDTFRDLYALGVVLFEMTTGGRPFSGRALDIVDQTINRPAPSPAAIAPETTPAWLNDLILQLMAKNPDERPKSALDVYARLERGLADYVAANTRAAIDDQPVAGKPPVGDVTLAFTDIEDSTPLWETFPSEMRRCLKEHNGILRAAISASGGYEVKTEGDAFMVAFGHPSNALVFAREVQRNLDIARLWPGEPQPGKQLRVRIGMLSGRPECERDPLHGRMDYFGVVVNRAARVATVAYGGQVVTSMSDPAVQAAKESDFAVHDVGHAELKGVSQAMHIAEIAFPDVSRVPHDPLIRAKPSTDPSALRAVILFLSEDGLVEGTRGMYGSPLAVGRSQSCDIVHAADAKLSRRHCTIAFRGASFLVQNWSPAGIFVDGVKCMDQVEVGIGARVFAGGLLLTVMPAEFRLAGSTDVEQERATGLVAVGNLASVVAKGAPAYPPHVLELARQAGWQVDASPNAASRVSSGVWLAGGLALTMVGGVLLLLAIALTTYLMFG